MGELVLGCVVVADFKVLEVVLGLGTGDDLEELTAVLVLVLDPDEVLEVAADVHVLGGCDVVDGFEAVELEVEPGLVVEDVLELADAERLIKPKSP